MSPDAALAVCRFAHTLPLMLIWGASAYLSALVTGARAAEAWRPLQPWAVAAAIVAAAATAATLPVETAFIGNGWVDAFNPSVMGDVLTTTTVGQAWGGEAAGIVLLLTALAWPGRIAFVAIAAAIALASAALTGHATMEDGALGLAHRLNDALHLLAAGAWLGGLVPLMLSLGAGQTDGTVDVLRRFSTAGHWIVGLVVATGIANTWLILGQPPADWSSPYQLLLSLKLALVAAMVALALTNRYALMPRVAATRGMLTAIRRGALIELLLGAVVIALVSVFGILDPM
ncbi:MAG TPA: copper homeostasis membrane protein CopD [Bauldia sp.]|nr:copper homeostasis membrane protein CopD [Bauldia sp.]